MNRKPVMIFPSLRTDLLGEDVSPDLESTGTSSEPSTIACAWKPSVLSVNQGHLPDPGTRGISLRMELHDLGTVINKHCACCNHFRMSDANVDTYKYS